MVSRNGKTRKKSAHSGFSRILTFLYFFLISNPYHIPQEGPTRTKNLQTFRKQNTNQKTSPPDPKCAICPT
jgi:hypothetical protein